MATSQFELKLSEIAAELGFDQVGVCRPESLEQSANFVEWWLAQGYHGDMDYMEKHLSLRKDPQQLLPDCRSAIVVAMNYFQPNPAVTEQPRIATYALGRDYHKVLRSRLTRLVRQLSQTLVGAKFRVCVDSAPVFERDFAQKAGLGWFGKNTMLINSQRGSWFFIGVVLTDAEIEPSVPAKGGCGTCTSCIDACPTGAIAYGNGRWYVNSKKCISYLTIEHDGPIDPELEDAAGRWTFGCDECQSVCPFNAVRASQPDRSPITKIEDFLERRTWLTLSEMATMDFEAWDQMTRGSAIRRAGYEGLRRNARLTLRAQRSSETGPEIRR